MTVYSLRLSSKGVAGFGQAVVKVLADSGIMLDEATMEGEVFHRVEVRCRHEENCRLLVEEVGTLVFFGLMVRSNSWLHQRSD